MVLTQNQIDQVTVRAVALELDDVQKTYGSGKNTTTALRGVSLRVAERERFALLGPNGAGKTTLVSILATLLLPSSGNARVFGHDVTRESGAVRSVIGYVPQDIALYPMLSAEENLRFFGSMYGLSGGVLKERVAEVLTTAGLEDVARKRVSTFSGGMKRRLNLAAGLLHRPRLLLLDEPTVGVDPQSRNHILDRIRELNERHGITVVYTTHYMEEVEALCSRVAIIDHGQIIADDSVSVLRGDASGVVITVASSRPKELAAALREAAGASDVVAAQSGRIAFTARAAGDGLRLLAEIAAADSIDLSDIDVSKPSLEQVFLRLTGRALRD